MGFIINFMGTLIAVVIIVFWGAGLFTGLVLTNPLQQPLILLAYLPLQTWLFTGLFITAHDAMHGTVSHRRKLNNTIGYVASLLYAGMWYPKLLTKHRLHHTHSGTPGDPDYHAGNQDFFAWWFKFMMQYLTLWQLLIMALLFNVGLIWFSEAQLLVLWVAPAIASTFQLFYFGTYRPHRLPHLATMMPHRARSQPRRHWLAFLSCYFFGYHFEHHASPRTPWWQLHTLR